MALANLRVAIRAMAPDQRSHRGAHPNDEKLFGKKWLDILRQAVEDLSLLLTREYAINASLALVGDRYQLRGRQRLAARRCACSDLAMEEREGRRIETSALSGARVWIDGFNLIITLEAALSGGVILRGRDGCLRDLSSVHGSYRSVHETDAAIDLVGRRLAQLGPERVDWVLDRPVSNSGRLAQRIRDKAAEHGWPWTAELLFNPDGFLSDCKEPVVTSDSAILDRGVAWVNLADDLIANSTPEAWIVDLSAE